MYNMFLFDELRNRKDIIFFKLGYHYIRGGVCVLNPSLPWGIFVSDMSFV